MISLQSNFSHITKTHNSLHNYLNYLNRTHTVEEGAKAIKLAITYLAKTKPTKQAIRAARLTGACFDSVKELDNKERSLDMIITALNGLDN